LEAREDEILNDFKKYKLATKNEEADLYYRKCREEIANIINYKHRQKLLQSEWARINCYYSMIDRASENALYWFEQFVQKLIDCKPEDFEAEESTQDEMQS
jgi:hypothetical protein